MNRKIGLLFSCFLGSLLCSPLLCPLFTLSLLDLLGSVLCAWHCWGWSSGDLVCHLAYSSISRCQLGLRLVASILEGGVSAVKDIGYL